MMETVTAATATTNGVVPCAQTHRCHVVVPTTPTMGVTAVCTAPLGVAAAPAACLIAMRNILVGRMGNAIRLVDATCL